VRNHRFGVGMKGDAEVALDLFRKPVSIRVVQAHFKRLESPQHSRADPAGSYRAHLHPF
jgi:hypothetical protein